MSNQTAIKRYLTIIRKLQKGKISFQDLSFHLDNESEISGYPLAISQRTFQRDIKAIEELFGYAIRSDKTQNVYYLDEEVADIGSIRLLEAYELMDTLRTAGNYTPHVFFESRVPTGMEHFFKLLKAAKEHRELHLSYKKFYQDNVEKRIVHPFALKESRGRWYLIAWDAKDKKIKTFGLDRISDAEITRRKFDKGAIPDIKKYFEDCFGIINPPGILPKKVMLLFSRDQGQYIHTYPLHHSQQLLEEDSVTGEMTFELRLKITYDFVMELLSFGEELEVLAPKSLARQISNICKTVFEYYI